MTKAGIKNLVQASSSAFEDFFGASHTQLTQFTTKIDSTC
jgi:hypothetical protein